jgi:hypothetical protein
MTAMSSASDRTVQATVVYTPGPWAVEYLPYSTNDQPVAEIPSFRIYPCGDGAGPATYIAETNEHMDAVIQAANARLIAAAPALLRACQMVVDRWERGDLAEGARACADAIANALAA